MSRLRKALRQLIPPMLVDQTTLRRLPAYTVMEAYRSVKRQSRHEFFRNEMSEQIKTMPEVNQLFPEERLKDHYVYGNIRDTAENPDIYITQLRFYRVYEYFRDNYPELFKSETRVLDVGDTSGILFQAMGRKGLSLNINQECVDFIKAKGIDAVKGDAEHLDFSDKSFDYVFCFQTLEHVPNPLRVLRELGRVAKKKVFLSIPYARQTQIYDLAYWVDLKQTSWMEKNVREVDCHVFELSAEDLISLLSHTSLAYETNFPIAYFSDNYLKGRLLNKRFESYFNFFVLEPRYEAVEGREAEGSSGISLAK